MRWQFEEVGLELLPGSTFGSFAGEATFEWDDISDRWFCSMIRLTSDGGKSTELGLFRDTPNTCGQLFAMLEQTLLRRASECDEDWYAEPFRRAEKRKPAFRFEQREFI
jgi:hypothetical protein